MEVGKLLSRWWFVALVSLTIGVPSTSLITWSLWGSMFPGMLLDGPPLFQLFFWISWATSFGGFIVSSICLLLIIAPRHTLERGRFLGPDELVRTGYEVTRRRGSFDVRVHKYSVIRVYEGEHAFRCLPTPTIIWTMGIAFLTFLLAALVLPLALHVHHRCWKGLDDITMRTNGHHAPVQKGVEDMVHDSLLRAYMLARGAADFRRSQLQDRVLILVVLALVAWTVLLMVSIGNITGQSSLTVLVMGTLAIAAGTTAGALILRRRSRKDIDIEEDWARRMLSVLKDEDQGASAIELLLSACFEMPRWLQAHRKGIWFREPGKTLLIFILFNLALSAFLQQGSIWWGFTLFGVVCMALGMFLFLKQIVSVNIESRDLARQWERRIGELERILETGQGR